MSQSQMNKINNEAVFCLQAKKPLHSVSYEHRVPKKKTKIKNHALYNYN